MSVAPLVRPRRRRRNPAPMVPLHERGALNAGEAAAYMGMSRARFDRARKRQGFPQPEYPTGPGGFPLWSRALLDEWVRGSVTAIVRQDMAHQSEPS